MKTLKLFSAIALCSILFISCNQENNSGAVYFLKNNLSEKLIISNTQQTTSTSATTRKEVDLQLSSSEFFNFHIQNLETIDVLSASYQINDTSIDLSSSVIKIGDIQVPSFNTGTSVEITDATILASIARMLEQDGRVTFSFENDFSTNVNLEINVEIDLQGTFVH
jgi:hypothetical protein